MEYGTSGGYFQMIYSSMLHLYRYCCCILKLKNSIYPIFYYFIQYYTRQICFKPVPTIMGSNSWSQYLAEVAAAGGEKEPLAWDQTLESAADNGYDGSVYTGHIVQCKSIVLHLGNFTKQQRLDCGQCK